MYLSYKNPSSNRLSPNINIDMGNQKSSFSPNDDQRYRKSSQSSETRDAENSICDIMISYSHLDMDFAKNLKYLLEENGFSVWIDLKELAKGDKFFDKIGEAVTNSRLVIPIISKNQVISKFCIGEVALAYISGQTMIPCTIGNKRDLLKAMPPGMRLQLAEFDWFEYPEEANWKESRPFFDGLMTRLNELINFLNSSQSKTTTAPKKMNDMKTYMSQDSEPNNNTDVDFWEENFGDITEVEWNVFENVLKNMVESAQYRDLFQNDFPHLCKRLYKEFQVKNTNTIKRTSYTEFLLDGNTCSFMTRVKHYWSEILAVKDVFDIDSNVRLDAIEKLSRYPSKQTIEALLDLTEDEDPNCRAVSLITLSKVVTKISGKHLISDQMIIEFVNRIADTLNDPDRLVRECSCLALANIKMEGSFDNNVVSKVVEVWRNDVIASVRQCAELALRQFDNEQARMAIRMAEILKSEIEQLK